MTGENTNAREIRANGVAFAWLDKAALRKIREACDREHTVNTALSVYLALAEISSDAGSPTFTTTHAWIAQISGLKVRTVEYRLGDLREIGLVRIQTPKLKAPSTYTLLSCSALSAERTAPNAERSAPTGKTVRCGHQNKRNKEEQKKQREAGDSAPSVIRDRKEFRP